MAVSTTLVKNLKLSDSVAKAADIDTAIAAAIESLGQAVSYGGVADQDPSAGNVTTVNTGTAFTAKAGVVVSYGTKEYICTAVTSGTQTWKELGDEGAYVVKNAAITPVTTETLLKIKYDAKGLVTGSAAVQKSDIPGMSDKVETSTKIAGLALTGDISKSDLLSAINVTDGATKVEASESNGKIKINGTETTVYTLPSDVVQDSNYKHITVGATSVSDGTTTASIPQGALASKDEVGESDLASALAAKVHTHSNKALLDTYTQTEANLADAVAKKHAHDANAVDITSTVKSGYDSSKASYDAVKTACDNLSFTKTDNTTVDDIADALEAVVTALKTSAS